MKKDANIIIMKKHGIINFSEDNTIFPMTFEYDSEDVSSSKDIIKIACLYAYKELLNKIDEYSNVIDLNRTQLIAYTIDLVNRFRKAVDIASIQNGWIPEKIAYYELFDECINSTISVVSF